MNQLIIDKSPANVELKCPTCQGELGFLDRSEVFSAIVEAACPHCRTEAQFWIQRGHVFPTVYLAGERLEETTPAMEGQR